MLFAPACSRRDHVHGLLLAGLFAAAVTANAVDDTLGVKVDVKADGTVSVNDIIWMQGAPARFYCNGEWHDLNATASVGTSTRTRTGEDVLGTYTEEAVTYRDAGVVLAVKSYGKNTYVFEQRLSKACTRSVHGCSVVQCTVVRCTAAPVRMHTHHAHNVGHCRAVCGVPCAVFYTAVAWLAVCCSRACGPSTTAD